MKAAFLNMKSVLQEYAKVSKFILPIEKCVVDLTALLFTSIEMVLFYKVKRFYHLHLGYRLQCN